ncbi:MAG: hypothetical protein RBT46_01735 [Weeksellaceae bacterium]|nr:hypothetical protein [Weeksellaceae bacterium]
MKIHFYISFVVGLFLMFTLKAQQPVWKNENLRQDTVQVKSTIIQLNSKFILAEKFKIQDENGEALSELFYKMDYDSARLILDESLIGKKISIQYFVHPDLQQESIFTKDTALIHEAFQEHRYYNFMRERRESKPLFDGLNSRGSLVRGIRFGNNQSASVQSSLDLQLSGQLSDKIGINAVISDNNVPIQADGYTQTLKEFDKVYIELFNKNSKIRAGHIDLNQEKDFFGNFSQKVTGLQIETELTHSNDAKTKIQFAGSVSRGEFVSKKFTGQNGNQGPYRLSGNHNELYIIIVSGSERVYLDGILLTRGEDRDYVINYNTGELTFTSNRLITDNSRISVEYLYANRMYSQVLLYGGIEHESERFRIAGHFYSNGDSKNNPLSDNLSDEDKEILSNAGNDTSLMFASTATPTQFDPDRNLYRKILVNGVEVFEFSTNPEEELYQVNFTFVGNNKGNYIASSVVINGKIFEYIPPLNGIPQGNYEPIRQLIPPKQLQLYTLNSEYKLKRNGILGLDLGMSNEDLNLFSSKDDGENIGFAGRIYGNRLFEWNKWKIQPLFEFSYIQENFRSIQRLRNIEFSRDFNLEEELSNTDQIYLKTGINTIFNDSLKLNYTLHYLQNKEQYTGIKNDVGILFQTEKNYGEAQFSLLNSKKKSLISLEEDQSEFLRYQIFGKRKLVKNLWIGAQYSGETNKIEDHLNAQSGNNLSEMSFRWNEVRGMLGIGDTAKVYAQLSYYKRSDDSVRLGSMQRITKSDGWILESKLINQQNHRLEMTAHYRMVKYEVDNLQKEEYITGNLRWHKGFFRNGLVLTAFYELGSGVEPQREFEYVKVTDGTGIYKWTDYNGDGIQQLDEFEVAEYQDEANYIRVFTNTVNYVKTNKNNFNFSVRFRFKELFDSESKFLARWLWLVSLQSQNSVLKNGKTLEWNPFSNSGESLGKSRNLRSVLNFNQGNQYKWSSAYTYNQSLNRNYIFTGGESRDVESHLLNLKYRPWENFYLLNEVEKNRTKSHSDLFESRRFIVEAWRVKPQISYQIETKFSASLNFTYQRKTNISGNESLKQSDFGAEIQWNDGSKSSLLGNFNFIKNNFSGNAQSVVGNQMMEGLKPGNNLVWQLIFQRQLNSFLSININYDGRKTEENKAIHSGNIQIQARF